MNHQRFKIKMTHSPRFPVLAFLDDKPYPRGTLALSDVAKTMTAASFDNVLKPFVKMMNAPGGIVTVEAGAILSIEHSAAAGRAFVRRHAEDGDLVVKPIRGRGGYAVKGEGNLVALARANSLGRRYMDAQLKGGLYVGQSYAVLDGYDGLSDAERLVVTVKAQNNAAKAGDGKVHRYDTGGYFVVQSPVQVLKTEAIFCARAITEAIAGKVPAAAEIAVRFMRKYALRAKREGLGLTMWGIHKGGGFVTPDVVFYNKGDGIEPTKHKKTMKEDFDVLLGYIEVERRAFDPQDRGLDYWRETSRRAKFGDKAAEAELRSTLVFIIKGGRGLTYDNLTKTYLRPLFKAAGIKAGLHMLRHEYVYERLREIEAMDVPERDKRAKRLRLAKDMGWSTGEAMFRIYDAYEQERRRIEDQILFNLRREQGITAAQQLRAAPDDRPQVAPLPERASRSRSSFFAVGRALAA